jgi:hypothetical protein
MKLKNTIKGDLKNEQDDERIENGKRNRKNQI